MSASVEFDDLADIASTTGLSKKEVLEIMELVGPNRASVIREAMILKKHIDQARDDTRRSPL